MSTVQQKPDVKRCLRDTKCAFSPDSVRRVVTAKTQYKLRNAKEYFEEHLCVGDYYDEGQRVAGEWFGLGAGRLGLAGKVRAEDFLRLCDNQHPATGETLTQRLKERRVEKDGTVANRRIFYDFTFSPPKSVSLAAFLGGDEQIFALHEQAIKLALKEFEAFAATRIRSDGAQ
ncbi:MAG TPA: relaxase domain-containing protein, partial [Verrucomicrobiae bacterium]|nr:relaxase domain-containing protein [Verrucomicrobiae bacterium]